MPKAKDWHIPRPRAVITGRKVKTTLMERVDRLVRGKVIPKPLWYDVALSHPPPLKLAGSRPKAITFPEDELRDTWMRRNPGASMIPKALFLDDENVPGPWRRHPADTFAERQLQLMRQGKSKEEAYRAVVKEQREEETVAALGTETARQQALSLGASAADADNDADSGAKGLRGSSARAAVQQRLLRQFAEEARDQGLPYPRRWFDANGQWRGIGLPRVDELQRETRRALDRVDKQSDLVREILSGIDLRGDSSGDVGGSGDGTPAGSSDRPDSQSSQWSKDDMRLPEG